MFNRPAQRVTVTERAMRIKDTKQVYELAEHLGKCTLQSSEIIDSLALLGYIEKPGCEYYGLSIGDILNEGGHSLLMVADEVFPGITTKQAEIFGQLIIVGNGNCPDCGAYMTVVDQEYMRTQVDYDSEPDIVVIWENKRCDNCGFELIGEPDVCH